MRYSFGVVAILMMLLFLSCTSEHTEEAEITEAATVTRVEESPLPDVLEFTDSYTFRWGDNFGGVLRRFEVPAEQMTAISYLLQNTADIARIPVGTDMQVRMADSGLVRLVVSPPRSNLQYRVDRTGHMRFTAFIDTTDTDTFLVRYSGEIDLTLYGSFLEQGGTPELAVKYIEVFQFVHYFSSETRTGDQYNLIVEEVYMDGERFGFGKIMAAQYIQNHDTLTAVRLDDGTIAGGGEFFDASGQSFRRDLLRAPFPAARVTSTYGLRNHPISGDVRMHHGVDFGAAEGTPVAAAGSGIVTIVRRGNTGLGNWMHIVHDRSGFETRYGHFRAFANGIHEGGHVRQGQIIGYVGQTGYATGPHLHYETFRDGRRVNPLTLRGSPVQQLDEGHLPIFLQRTYRPWRVMLEQPGVYPNGNGFCGPLPESTSVQSSQFTNPFQQVEPVTLPATAVVLPESEQ